MSFEDGFVKFKWSNAAYFYLGIIFYDFVTDVVISKLAPVLDNHPLASDFRKKIALAVCPTEANDFLNLMQNSGHLLFHIKTKKPDYPMTEFIEVLQRHKRRDVVKKVLSIKEMEDRRKGAQDWQLVFHVNVNVSLWCGWLNISFLITQKTSS